MKETTLHLYDRGRGEYETLSIAVERDNKDCIKAAVQKLQEAFQYNKELLINLDATVIVKPQNMQPIFDEARKYFGGKMIGNITMAKIACSPNLKDAELLSSITELNEKIDAFTTTLHSIRESNEEIFSRHSELPTFEFSAFTANRRFNFHSYIRSLLDLYTHCFMPYYKLLSCGNTNPNPIFQRKLVWPLEKKQLFIESILNEIPLGSFYINKTGRELRSIIGEEDLLWDGKQRIYSIDSFIRGDFPVKTQNGMLYYHQAMGYFNFRLEDAKVNLYESDFKTLEEIIEAYCIINQGQVKHTDEDLEYAMSFLKARK